VISRATPEFWELYRSLAPDVPVAARKSIRKIPGKSRASQSPSGAVRSDRRAWSVRITRDHRAVALRSGEEWVWFWIGNHKEFDRRFPA